MSILIAEDNVAQRRYLRELIEREFSAHLPVIEAGDGEETTDLALKHKPELCVLDIQMPRLSGVKAARAIWQGFPQARIIFWTQFPHEIYINARGVEQRLPPLVRNPRKTGVSYGQRW